MANANNKAEIIACRDISNASEWTTQLRELIESTPFHCKVSFSPQYRVGLIRVEYEGHSEQDIKDCDLKLTAKIISFLETKEKADLVFLPLEFGPRWFLGLTKEEQA